LSLQEYLSGARADKRTGLDLCNLSLLSLFKHLVVLLADIVNESTLIFNELFEVSALLCLSLLPGIYIRCELAVFNLFLSLFFAHQLDLFIPFMHKLFHLMMKNLLVHLLWLCIRPLSIQQFIYYLEYILYEIRLLTSCLSYFD
jgi:hypothetical protein